MQSNIPDFEEFSNEYNIQEKEILVLTSDESGAASKLKNSWQPSQYFLAYVDLETHDVKNGEGRINWLISEEQYEEFGISYPYYFKQGTVYHLKARELADKTVAENSFPSFYNRFLVTKVIAEDIQNNDLLSILKEYRTPVEIVDPNLGTFLLDKNYDTFSGEINWLGKMTSVTIEVDKDDKETWKKGLNILQSLFDSQQKHDEILKKFAAKQLTKLANEWSEDGDKEISQDDFASKINMAELVVNYNEDYTAYYDDGDLFYGHIIEISGNIKTGLESANIAG